MEGTKGFWEASFLRELILHEALLSGPNHLPKATTPKTIKLAFGFQLTNFRGDTNIHTVNLLFLFMNGIYQSNAEQSSFGNETLN